MTPWNPGRGDPASGDRVDSPVEEYLDRLLAAAPGPPREVRALLAEAEAHLRDATTEGQAGGLSADEAERQAVARFGPVRSVATAEARRHAVPFPVLVRQTVASGLLLGAVGGIAVGISGILAAVMGALGGSTFIVDISAATRLAPSDCARWLAQDPSAHSCYQAALSDWTAEVIGYRLVVGVLGLLSLGAYFLMRRHWSRRRRFTTLPAPVSDTVAVILFGLSGLWALGLGIDWVAQGHNGAGQWLAAAPIALAVAGYFGFRLLGDLRTAPS
jgi:hypothetical protein